MKKPLYPSHMKHLTIIIAAIFSFSGVSFAAYPIVRNFSKTVYRSGTQNWDITQDTEGGTMYFANNNGVLEYDGNSWSTYPVTNWTNVRSVLYDSSCGRIYAGGFHEFGYCHTDSSGKMCYTSLMGSFDLDKDMEEIWKIHKSGETFYLQSNRDIFMFSGGRFSRAAFGHKIDCSAIIRQTLMLSSLATGPMMLMGDSFVPIPSSGDLKGQKICGFIPYENNTVLIVTEYSGIYIYDWKSLRKFNTGFDNGLSDAQVFCTAYNSTWLAFGTVTDGVYLLNRESGASIHLNKECRLQNNTILSMHFDKTGNLWLGLDKGIDYIVLNSPERSAFRSEDLYGSGYASLLDGNRLYLGTNQGLYYTDYDKNHHSFGEVVQVSGLNGQVWNLVKIGDTVFCCHDRGLFTVEGNRTARIGGISGTWKVAKMKKREDRILGCSYDGLFFLQKSEGKWIYDGKIRGFSESSGKFEEDNDGKIWLYHWMKGLFRLTITDRDSVARVEYFGENYGLPSNRNNICNIFRNRIVLSSDSGFWRYDRKSDRVVPENELNDIFPEPTHGLAVVESPYRDLFFLSGDMNAIAFQEPDGSYTLDTTSLKFMRDKQILGFENLNFIDRNTVLVNTENGFSFIDLEKIRKFSGGKGNRVFIRSLSVTNSNSDSLVYGARTPHDTTIILPYRCNSIKIGFVCPQFETEGAMEYSYIMEKFDNEWSPFSTLCSKEYTKLPQGEYTFRVRASDRFRQVTSETSVNLVITPPWYLTVWAYIIYSILASGTVFMLLLYANMKSAAMARQVEKEKETEIEQLRNQTLEHDLKHKSQDLATSTMNLIRKNEILLQIRDDISRSAELIAEDKKEKSIRILQKIQRDIRENIEHDDHWTRFEENFDIVYEDYLKRLGEKYRMLTIGDKKLCAYLKMGLCSKDIAPLLNMSVHSVEMARYRLRKKMGLSREINLTDFLQHF